MKTIDCIDSSTTQKPASAVKTGEQTKLQSSGKPSSNESATGKPLKRLPSSRLLTREAACKRLGCHWQTLLYREKRGDFTGIKIGRQKFYVATEIEQVRREKPVTSKPNKAKQRALTIQQPTKSTLWNRIIAFFAK